MEAVFALSINIPFTYLRYVLLIMITLMRLPIPLIPYLNNFNIGIYIIQYTYHSFTESIKFNSIIPF